MSQTKTLPLDKEAIERLEQAIIQNDTSLSHHGKAYCACYSWMELGRKCQHIRHLEAKAGK
jgi:hypothetical protein